jgi:hypothetical protein
MAAPIFREAVLAGPRLIARSPVAFVAWVLLRIAALYAPLAVLLWATEAHAGFGVGTAWALLVPLPFESVLAAAILRAALKPDAKGFVFARLGHTEFRMAGLLILATLVIVLIALPTLTAVGYIAVGLQQPAVARLALPLGLAVAVLALTRFSPTPAILVDRGRFDLSAAWQASKGRYWLLVLVILAVAAIERGLGEAGRVLIAPTGATSWATLFAPPLLASIVWRSLVDVACLVIVAGAVATVWLRRQTLS